MLRPGSGLPRALRAGSLAGLATLLGAMGHLLGGMPLAGSSLLFALLVGTPLAWAITGRRLRVGALTAALALGQLLAHLAFVAAAGARSVVSASSPASAPGSGGGVMGHGIGAHLGGGHLGGGHLGGGHLGGRHLGGGHLGGGALGLDARMLLTHLLATIALATLAARGEAVLWRVWERLRPWAPPCRLLSLPELPAGLGWLVAPLGPGPTLTSHRTRGPPCPIR